MVVDLLYSRGDVANLARMPSHAQREISASVVALQVHAFEASLRRDTHWDSAKRLVNWLAHQGSFSGRWTQVIPWDRQGYLNMANTAYVVSFCRRYRIPRPARLRGPDPCKCGWAWAGLGRNIFDGDHDEADCAKRGWSRTMVHNTIVDALARFLKDCGMDNVRREVKYWDPARIGSDGSRRVPDVTCTHPRTGVEYVVDARIFLEFYERGAYGLHSILSHRVGCSAG